MIQRQFKRMLGRLIFEERQRNNTSIADCSRALKTIPVMYEKIELGSRHIGWKYFDKALKYFHKDIEISLVDAKQSKTPPCY